MKNKLILILTLLLIPCNVFAYSDYIIPGGQTIGIEVNNNGIIVIGFYKVNGKFNQNKLRIGDTILKVNDLNVTNIEELVETIGKEVQNDKVNLTIKRSNKLIDIEFNLSKVDDTYKTGLYVKDNLTGIGTLTYIDPQTKIYGALGHEITESTSGNLIEVKTGNIFRSSITTIEPSYRGIAGTKNAKFYSNTKYGNITKNTIKGIYGTYTKDISKQNTMQVGSYYDIKLGKATIRTVIKGEEIKDYEINIDKVATGKIKNIHFVITDEELINKTGGVIQGMSGSPIIQDKKIIGAVTHVIVDNPVTGYGILITNMLEEGEK